MKSKKFTIVSVLTALFLTAALGFSGCGDKNVSDYYTFDVSSISTVMLKGESQVLSPELKNLGESVSNPKYGVEITESGEDVTGEVYDGTTKVFSPADVGTYSVKFIAHNDKDEIAVDEDGQPFTKTVEIEVSILSFAAKDSAGTDVTVDESDADEAKITFGESYANAEDGQDSGQYKITGLTFDGNFSITYKIAYGTFNEKYEDPALYFGFDRNDADNHDDCIKLSTGSGHFATWIYDDSNALADLSSNAENGWNFEVWYNTNNSVSNDVSIENSTHRLTIERYIDAAETQAVYVILWDYTPFAYLNVHGNFTSSLSGLWVESVCTNCTISIEEHRSLEADTAAPVITAEADGTYYAGTLLYVGSLFTFTDNVGEITERTGYENIMTPKYSVTDKDGANVSLSGGALQLEAGEEYTITCTVTDFSGNETTAKVTIVPEERDSNLPVVDLDETASVTVPLIGTKIYVSATDETDGDLSDSKNVEIKIYSGANIDVTKDAYYVYDDETGGRHHVFLPTSTGTYKIVCTVTNSQNYSTSATKEINVVSDYEGTEIYGWKVYDIDLGGDEIILCKDRLIFTEGSVANSAKIAVAEVSEAYLKNWTISFDITGLKYTVGDTLTGKLNLTLMSMTGKGADSQFEDIAVGGKVGNDLWGFEANLYGVGSWVTYQWRTVWDNPTKEFMPVPDDYTVGCGRDASAYTQYAEGTHNWKIVCSTDENGTVTYTYYIDDQIEAVHKLPETHNNMNVLNFLQFQSQYMAGIVSDIRVTGGN